MSISIKWGGEAVPHHSAIHKPVAYQVAKPVISMALLLHCSPFPVACPAAQGSAASLQAKGRAVPVSAQRRAPLPLVGAPAIRASVLSPQEAEKANSFASKGRKNFPPGFIFGAGSSSYQVEGAWNIDGKGQSIVDTFYHERPDLPNGDVAVKSYYVYREDVADLKQMGMDSYRISISWSRILPTGKVKGKINQEGIEYYNNLIDEIIDNGMKPFVTLLHFDAPQALQDEYNGFLDKRIVNDFRDFSDLCFREFGDRVKHWVTINEPGMAGNLGFGLGMFPPGHCSATLGCATGDSLVEPYIVKHNFILAHAAAAKHYKENYQAKQEGEVGITLDSYWYEPYEDVHHQIEAQLRALDFSIGCFMEPLVFGDYPFSMRSLVRERLPTFTDEEVEMVKRSYDFIGINYYTARYAKNIPFSVNTKPVTNTDDIHVTELAEKDNTPIGPLNGSWLYVYPKGLRKLLVHIKERYGNPPIYVTENGTSELVAVTDTNESVLDDKIRIVYHYRHLEELQKAINDHGVNVKGYYAWSLLDSFEWSSAYNLRFGLVHTDLKRDFKRIPKASAKWFAKFLKAI